MYNVRTQFLIGYLILIFILMGVIVGGILQVRHLGTSVDRILKNNYISVVAAENMKEFLERQDSAATFYLAGQVGKARKQYQFFRPLFAQAADVEAHNITEPGEQQLSDDIQRQFARYQKAIERLLYANPPMPPEQARAYYFHVLEPAFLRLKQRAQDVLDLNQEAIVEADKRARTEARRAFWMGITASVLALGLALFFSYKMVNSALSPLRSLVRQAEEIGAGHFNQRIEVHRTDEIGALGRAFNRMAERLQEARRVEEERYQRAERMSEAALESLYDPVIVADAEGKLVHVNRAAEGLFGPEASLVGKPIDEAIRDKSIVVALHKAIHQQSASVAEDEAGMVDLEYAGIPRTYRLRTTPMKSAEGALLGAVAVLEDITHLRQLDRLKTEFIGIASHELRTPVTSLQLSVDLLQEGTLGPLTPEQQEVIRCQKEDLQRLDRMMRDLLDITRLETGATPPRFEIVSAAQLVQNAVEAIEPQAKAKNLKLNVEVSPPLPQLRADPAQINRVLLNLLNNAVRFTAEGGQIHVKAYAADGKVFFSVKDTGIGIPPEYLPRIFERFVQVPGVARSGAGLGLSIAQTIVKAHGGQITVESTPGKGSTFTFYLPVKEL